MALWYLYEALRYVGGFVSTTLVSLLFYLPLPTVKHPEVIYLFGCTCLKKLPLLLM